MTSFLAIALLVSSYISARYADLFLSLLLIAVMFRQFAAARLVVLISTNKLLLYSVLACSLLATILSLSTGLEFSSYQFVRSFALEALLFYALASLSSQQSRGYYFSSISFERILASIQVFIVLVAILRVVDLLAGTQLMPGIYLENTSRVFPPLNSIIVPIIMIAYFQKKRVITLAGIILLLSFQSKSAFALMMASLVCVLFSEYGQLSSNYMHFKIKKSAIALIASMLAALVFAAGLFGNRFYDLISEGDQARVVGSQLALSSLNSTEHLILGIGSGVPHSEGYFYYLSSTPNVDNRAEISPEQESLYNNARFDIESFFPFLLVRHGILGSFLFLIALALGFRTRTGKILISMLLLILGLGGSILNTAAGVPLFVLYLYIDFLLSNPPSFANPV